MPTGACGINCDLCRLHVMGICSTCGSPAGEFGRAKLAFQREHFGAGCPVLSCCEEKGIDFCLRDCNEFPCETLHKGGYPYSEAFLSMQARRRLESKNSGSQVWLPSSPEFWERLIQSERGDICSRAGAVLYNDGRIDLSCLNEQWEIDISKQQILKRNGAFGGEWDRQMPPLILIYLATAGPLPLSKEMAAPREVVPGGDFFQGIYRLETGELENFFGECGEDFIKAARKIGGITTDKADFSIMINIFPKFRVEYLLWTADDEFPARINILLPEDTTKNLPPDAAALIVNLLNGRLLFEGQ